MPTTLQKLKFIYESRMIFGIQPKKNANLVSEIISAFAASQLDLAEKILNQYYPPLATHLNFGYCDPLKLTKSIIIGQKDLPFTLFVVRVKENSIIYEGNFAQTKETWLIKRLLAYHSYLQSIKIGPDPFTLCIGDFYDKKDPVWVACANQISHKLIPDSDFIGSKGYQAIRKKLEHGSISFKERQNVLFWRGSPNCRQEFAHPWRNNPRLALCLRARDLSLSVITDVKVVQVQSMYADRGEQAEIQAQGFGGNHINVMDFQRFKYHIDIDGWSNAWSSLFIKLIMGCVIFKVTSQLSYRQWYYNDLIPFENFIPIKNDLSDLEDKVEWAHTHQVESAEISRNARNLALKILQAEDIEQLC